MSFRNQENADDSIFQRAIDAVRNDHPDPEAVRRASDRAWQSLSQTGEARETCREFQALIPDLLAGSLLPARRLLLEDHVSECVACRKVLHQARYGETRPAVARLDAGGAITHGRTRWWKWGIAAVILLGAGITQWTRFEAWYFNAPGGIAVVRSVTGSLLRVSESGLQPLRPGETIAYGETVRTTRGSGAVLELGDGSRMEVSDRSEFSIRVGWQGTTLALDRGRLIVEAAPQGSGSLSVATNDCRVDVKGTIFSVNHGTRGSRVSVIEGEVWVRQGGRQTVLYSGQQYATQESLQRVPLGREISWSRDASRHLALLKDLSALQHDLKHAVLNSDLRFESPLVPLLPSGTVAVGSIPNVSERLEEGLQLFQQRVQESPELGEWYREHLADSESELQELTGRLQQLGRQLGPEILLALVLPAGTRNPSPLLLSEVLDAAALGSIVMAEIERFRQENPEGPSFELIESPEDAADPADGSQGPVWVWISSDLLAVSPSASVLREVGRAVGVSGAAEFAGSHFGSTLTEAYGEGVDWLFAVDMASFLNRPEPRELNEVGDGPQRAALNQLGFQDVQHFMVQWHGGDERNTSRAVLTFNQPARGMVSWLAEPAPMGALDFVSPDASLAAAFVVKDPVQLVEDIFSYLQEEDPETWQELVQFQIEEGINIENDIAAPLGGEAVIAIDGPLVPAPAWKVILEVYDPVRFQETIRWFVTKASERRQAEGGGALELKEENVSGQAYYIIQDLQGGLEIHYFYQTGYLIAAPNRVLLDQALQFQQTGYSLTRAPKFLELLPLDGRINFSGLVYHNFGSLLAPFSGELQGFGEGLSVDDQQRLNQLIAETPPFLAVAYGEPNRITLAGSSGLESMGMTLGALAGFNGPRVFGEVLSGGIRAAGH